MIVSNVAGYEAPEKKIYVGDDAPKHRLDNLKTNADKIFTDYIKNPKPIIFGDEEEKKFWNAVVCHNVKKT